MVCLSVQLINVARSDVPFTNKLILLSCSLVGMKGTKSYLVRTVLLILVLKFHCLVPDIHFILCRFNFNK